MTADRKQSAVARRLSTKTVAQSNQNYDLLNSDILTRLNSTQSQVSTLFTLNDQTNARLNQTTGILYTQLDSSISGTIANLLARVSYYYLKFLSTIDLGTSGTGNGPLSYGMKFSLNIGTGYSYTKDQDITINSEDAPEAFIRGKVVSYDTVTGDLSVFVEEVGTGSSNRWTVNVGAPTIQKYDLDGGFASTDLNGGTASAGGGFDLDGGVA